MPIREKFADSSDATPEGIGQTYGQETAASVARPVRLSRGPGARLKLQLPGTVRDGGYAPAHSQLLKFIMQAVSLLSSVSPFVCRTVMLNGSKSESENAA